MKSIKFKSRYEHWQVLGKKPAKPVKKIKSREIVDILLGNRGLKTAKQKKEFLHPVKPLDITLRDLGIDTREIEKAIRLIKKAADEGWGVIVYGDYDADGICATAILWEALYDAGVKALPYIPGRFDEGYGLNPVSIAKLSESNAELKIIISVDNGIVAHKAVEKACDLGLKVIISDHHQKEKKLPRADAIVHTDKVSGAVISWIIAREFRKNIGLKSTRLGKGLELAAIGTIADQMPLLGPNRSIAKYGLGDLAKTKRPGLLALFKEAGIEIGGKEKAKPIGSFDVNYIIAPRLNAMGRLEHAVDSLRLLCTGSTAKAGELAQLLSMTNKKRQKIVDEILVHASEMAKRESAESILFLVHETYHEGVIGLAASKLVEEFGRPAIVVAKGETVSKASARSIPGFDIIRAIRAHDELLLGGGGHPMAAGFSIENAKLALFSEKISEQAKPLLTKNLLAKKLKVDMEVSFENLTRKFFKKLKVFEPTGVGNPVPTFTCSGVELIEMRTIGRDASHLIFKVAKEDMVFDAVAFSFADLYLPLMKSTRVDIVFTLDLNVWNGRENLQLKIRDIKPAGS
jgi:single-stranded-DNA-specific exonuclease